jgi:hypothetical protein
MVVGKSNATMMAVLTGNAANVCDGLTLWTNKLNA